MKYTIVIDKQPRTNPSDEKKEIEITLDHPLLKKGEVRDELIIQNKICKVIRNLNLNDDNSITVLDEPYEELIGDVDLELFLGDNYIYIEEENYMEIYIKYLTHNDLNDAYATKMELTSSITQTATGIMTEVKKKTDKSEIISTINQSAEEIGINASKIKLEGYTSINEGFSVDEEGNMICNDATINGSLITNGTAFKVDKDGTMTCSKANITGGKVNINTTSMDEYLGVKNTNNGAESRILSSGYRGINNGTINIGFNNITGSISCVSLVQTSLEEKKKNFEKFNNATDIIKNTDVYKYNLKAEKDDDKKHIGLVIGKKYRTPKEFMSKDGQAIELYSMTSICLQAIKELNEKVETLERKIKELEVKSNE